MTYLRALWIAEVSAAALLLASAALLALLGALAPGPSVLGPRGSAEIAFAYTLLVGAVPALVFGAPIYAFLRSKGRHRVWAAAALGVVPAALLVFFDQPLAPFALVVGLIVAIGTHYCLAAVRE